MLEICLRDAGMYKGTRDNGEAIRHKADMICRAIDNNIINLNPSTPAGGETWSASNGKIQAYRHGQRVPR